MTLFSFSIDHKFGRMYLIFYFITFKLHNRALNRKSVDVQTTKEPKQSKFKGQIACGGKFTNGETRKLLVWGPVTGTKGICARFGEHKFGLAENSLCVVRTEL